MTELKDLNFSIHLSGVVFTNLLLTVTDMWKEVEERKREAKELASFCDLSRPKILWFSDMEGTG